MILMSQRRNPPPLADSATQLLVLALCWTLIAWLNVTFMENPVVFIVLTGLLIMLTLAAAIVLIERRCLQRRIPHTRD